MMENSEIVIRKGINVKASFLESSYFLKNWNVQVLAVHPLFLSFLPQRPSYSWVGCSSVIQAEIQTALQ